MTQIPLTICDPSQEQFDPKRHRDEVIEVRRAEPLPLLGRRPEASPPTAENVCDPSTRFQIRSATAGFAWATN